MKAFISYSVNEHEEYIVTLLSYQLREHGFTIITSNNIFNIVDSTVRNQIFISQLFVGLISATGLQWERVLEEYTIADQNKTPAILLIEENVPVEPGFRGNHVFFNRSNAQGAIDEIKRKMLVKQPANNNGLGWLLGGAALVGLVMLLSEDRK